MTFLWRARAVTPRLTRDIALSLCVRQHGLDGIDVRVVHAHRPAQLALVLGGLLGEDVPLERLAPLHAAGGAYAKALRSAFLRLHLGHDDPLPSLLMPRRVSGNTPALREPAWACSAPEGAIHYCYF